MDIGLLESFKVTEIINHEHISIFIGTIDNKLAIYIKPFLRLIAGDTINFEETKNNQLKIRRTVSPKLIYPATPSHVKKYTSEWIYTEESYEDYLKNTDFLEVKWIERIINSSNNVAAQEEDIHNETFLVNNSDYFIVPDTKWDKKNLNIAYYLMIFKNKKYKSIRDLDDYELLERAKEDALNYCESVGLSRESFLLFFHYRPSYFRLHLHIVNISTNLNFVTAPSRNVLLDDVIKNLKIDKDYYKKTFYYVGTKNKL